MINLKCYTEYGAEIQCNDLVIKHETNIYWNWNKLMQGPRNNLKV